MVLGVNYVHCIIYCVGFFFLLYRLVVKVFCSLKNITKFKTDWSEFTGAIAIVIKQKRDTLRSGNI